MRDDKFALLTKEIEIEATSQKGTFEFEFPKEYRNLLAFGFSAAEGATYNALKTAFLSKDLTYNKNHVIMEENVPVRLLLADEVCPECKLYSYNLYEVTDNKLRGEITFTDTTLTYPVTIQLVLKMDDFVHPLTKEELCEKV